jgi:hypothetical protein
MWFHLTVGYIYIFGMVFLIILFLIGICNEHYAFHVPLISLH